MDFPKPLLVCAFGWAILLAYWGLAALRASRAKVTEGPLQRLQHTIPLGIGFYLLFTRRRDFLITTPLFATGWNCWIVYPGLALLAAGVAICTKFAHAAPVHRSSL